MSTVLRSLIWKEWREQRWKLAFGGMLLLGCTAIGLQTRIVQDDAIIGVSAMAAMLLLPLLVSMDLVAAERSNGSLPALLALPVHARTTLALKLLMGALVCIVPLAANLILAWLMAGNREVGSQLLAKCYIGVMGCSMSAFIWMACVGLQQSSEARAALVSIGLMLGWAAVVGIESILLRTNRGELPISLAITPIGLFFAWRDDNAVQQLMAVGTQLILLTILLYWSVRRFEKLSRTR